MGKQEIKTIFDVDIETGKGTDELEKVIVKPNPDKDNVMSVFLKKKGKPPKKYYDIRIVNNKEFVLVIEGDKRVEYIKFEGSKFRYPMRALPEKNGDEYIHEIAAFLSFSFSKLKIEARQADILFKLT